MKYNQVQASKKEFLVPEESNTQIEKFKMEISVLKEALDQRTRELQEAEESITSLQHKASNSFSVLTLFG